MRIDFDRISKLAGLTPGSNRRGLYEGADHDPGNEAAHVDEDAFDPNTIPMDEDAVEPGDTNEMEVGGEGKEPLDDMIEIDEVMLVQELRRAKRIMQENKRRQRLSESRQANRQQRIFEAQLKRVIDEEVQSVMDEMNLTSQWVYGNNRPRRSRRGYTHQGSMMPGIGFRRR